MITAGIDLSADPRKTGVAVLSWASDGCGVDRLSVGDLDDSGLCALIGEVDKSGIDCPLGWPSAFVDYVIAHRAGGHDLSVPPTRHSLTHRATDRHVTDLTGLRPLSVSADRIGSAAMRCAALLSTLTRAGTPIDRTGESGPVVEVYPAAALRIWGLPSNGYKGNKPAERQRREQLVHQIVTTLPWLDLGAHAPAMAADDDALDAVLCAVVAGLAVLGRCEPMPEDRRAEAEVEGWIALPRAGSPPFSAID